jgi:GNAT superfamily N-acetyltransferase
MIKAGILYDPFIKKSNSSRYPNSRATNRRISTRIDQPRLYQCSDRSRDRDGVGVDTELIQDGTYFVVEDKDADLVGCGGWSRRKTLFGSDKQLGRESEVLDPSRNSARIRAFFVRPDWARRGIGRELLLKCEHEARRDGFRSASLVATLTGQRFYLSSGYVGEERVDYPLAGGTTITFVPMTKGKL